MHQSKFDDLLDAMAYMAGILIFAISVFVCGSVVVRYLGFRPPIWVLQFTEYGLLWFTFLAAAWLLRHKGHIRIDTLTSRLRPKAQKTIQVLNDALGLIISMVIFIFGAIHTIELVQKGIMEVKGLTVPKAPFFVIIPIGGLVLAIQFARNIAGYFKAKQMRDK
jgi:TRAP-type C4-dicarboxylate transport system permease small subunit